jgi:hypothetical protein
MRLALVLTLAASALATSDARAFDAPRDDATLPDLAIAADEEIPIPELVAMWGRRFDALFVIDPALRRSSASAPAAATRSGADHRSRKALTSWASGLRPNEFNRLTSPCHFSGSSSSISSFDMGSPARSRDITCSRTS